MKAAYDQSAARLEIDLRALTMWNGTAEQLEAARVPLAASVGEMANRFTIQKAEETQLAKEGNKLRSDLERLESQIRSLETKGVIPTEDQLATAREWRDLGWTAVKDQWLNGLVGGAAEMSFLADFQEPLPKAFEAAVEAADSWADRLRLEAERVEQKRTALDGQSQVKRLMAEHAEAIQLGAKKRGNLEGEWAALWADAGIQPRTPGEMLEWLEKRGKLIEQTRDLRRTASEISDAEREETQWREGLASAQGISPAAELAELVLKARQRVEDSVRIRDSRATLITSKKETENSLQAENRSLQENQKALDTWEGRWKAALLDARLSDGSDPETLPTVIGLINSFWTQAGNIKELERRIQSMRADDVKYSAEVRALAPKTGRNQIAEMDALAGIKEVEKVARAAAANEESVKRIQEESGRQQKDLDKAAIDVEKATNSVGELLLEAKVQDVCQISETVDRSKRKKDLKGAVGAHLEALALSAGNIPLDTFIDQVHAVDADLLPVELEQIQDRIKALDTQKMNKTRELDDIDRTFKMKEEAVEVTRAAFEKNAAAARIDELTAEYMSYQIGADLLEKAMARYRLKHQDPILKRAGEYFTALTRGAFSGLTIAHEDNDRVMKGVRANGQNLNIDPMSDGTRDQLFLALRLAYIENHCASNAPCPVILDDVLMAFDDERASAALKALSELSKKTQVLVFTHHAHHVQLAEKALGSDAFQLHELNALSSALLA